MSLDTRWLEDFVALANEKNFSKAAKQRNITQPAFGRRIKSLEQAVEQILIDRSSTPIQLTSAGKVFLPIAKTILSQLDLGLAEISNQSESIFSPISIATPHSLSSPALIELVEQLQLSSNITYSVDVLRVDLGMQALENGLCDFFLGFDHISLLQPPFRNQWLGNGRFLLVSLAHNGQAIYSLDAPSVPYLRYSSESYSARLLEQHSPELPTCLKPIFESSMCQLHKEMVLLGKGVAWLPDLLIKKELEQGKIVALYPEKFHLPFTIRLYRYQTSLSPNAEKVWQQVQKIYSKQSPFCHPWQSSRSNT